MYTHTHTHRYKEMEDVTLQISANKFSKCFNHLSFKSLTKMEDYYEYKELNVKL